MAFAAVQPAMNTEGNHSLHPFFSKPPSSCPLSHYTAKSDDISEVLSQLEDIPTNDPNHEPDDEHTPPHAPPTKPRKKRSRKSVDVKEKIDSAFTTNNQLSLERFTRPVRTEHDDPTTASANAVIALNEDPIPDRKKRRKTASPPPSDASMATTTTMPGLDKPFQVQIQEQAQELALKSTSATWSNTVETDYQVLQRPITPEPTVVGNRPCADAEKASTMENKVDITTPKKQIKITKTGKLVSTPPKPVLQGSSPPKKRRGRKPTKMKVLPTVTIISYGSDATSRQAIGEKIEAILSSKKSTTKRSTTIKKEPLKPSEPAKITHPFFRGKASQKTEDVPAKPVKDPNLSAPRKSAVTPGKLRAEARRERSPGPMPAFGASLGSNRVVKQSGLYEASWPTRETAHVRNLDNDSMHSSELEVTRRLPLRARKLKNRVHTLKEDEEMISRLAKDLATEMRLNNEAVDLDFRPPEDVRLPTRLLTTGLEIQQRVQERLQIPVPWPNAQFRDSTVTHPAIASLFVDIEHTLTPFDEGRCEGQSWAQKYSPKCAAHVLHRGKDAIVMRDWLQSLTVMAVGGAQGIAKADILDGKRPPKKKRKKAVDDFIVSDEDEDEEDMVEILDGEQTLYPKSVRQPRWTRNKNVILVSGPHGCGKSATVYAVAKELDFEIFEINSGTRRSGKDIIDRVGDMTANHLVNHKRVEAHTKEKIAATDDDVEEPSDAALQKDIASGRQGTMMTFFKTNATTKPIPKVEAKVFENKGQMATAHAGLQKTDASTSSQKQSLILFEEADILFEEDQQFWAQVTKLAAHSKRPIVITCNDERQIPVHDLPLAAILRLRSPPIDLATDYMLVLAGREGHILEREAISDLYTSKNHDLRSSITELNLWCQMSVGDKKGGLEWLYQRWPPGKDVDANGRLLRVASEGTYQYGMGWLSHNVFETKNNAVFDREEELLDEVWAEWGISPTDWEATSLPLIQSTQSDTLQSLERMDMLSETISASDVFCSVGLPSYAHDYDEPADPTLPLIFSKLRQSYTLAAPLLQTDPKSDFLRLDTSICIQTHLLACRAFPELSTPTLAPTRRNDITETGYAKRILEIRKKEIKVTEEQLSRPYFSYAFDALAAPPEQMLFERTSFNLTPSSFDRTFNIITLELAPYVRSIVAHEQILETERLRMSNLLSGGGNGKRPRTTRASRVALEGGVRETKRRDRWFDADVSFEAVMATGGKEWAGLGWRSEEDEREATASVTGTQESLSEVQDVTMHGTEEYQEM
jgi:DNA polymerase III delta prime subunit